MRAYNALGVVSLLRGLAHVITHPFARIGGRGYGLWLRLRLLRRLLRLLLSVVMSSLRSWACLGLQQMLNQELVVVVHFLLGSLRAHAHHRPVRFCFGGIGMIRLGLGGRASGIRVCLGRCEKSRRENRGNVFI